MKQINIAKDFTETPGSAFITEGYFSGEEFRISILVPKLKEAVKNEVGLIINLDGTAGFHPSFLEEAFGGIIRERILTFSTFLETISFISNEEPELVDAILEFVREEELIEEK